MSKKPRRLIVVSDNHGDMVCKDTASALWEFIDDWRPEIRVHAGDIHDLRNLRRGASDDEKSDSMDNDWEAGLDFAHRFFDGGKENHLLFGNHDCRLEVMAGSWADLLSEAIRNDGHEHPGKGWYQFHEIMLDPSLRKEFPRAGAVRMRMLIREGLATGTIEKKEVFLKPEGSFRRVRHIFYRIK